MSPTRMSKIESAMRMALEFNKALNRQDIPGMMHLLSKKCVFESPAPSPEGSEFIGKEAISRYWEKFFQKIPDAQFIIEEIFGLGKRCILRWRTEWKDEAGGKEHERGVDIIKVEDGSICEIFSYGKGKME